MKIAQPNETEEMYQKNLEMLAPPIKEIVSKITEQELNEKIEVTYNAEGYPVCKYRRDGSCFHITSEHPAEEAAAWSRMVETQDSSEIFLYGCGFGYSLFELFEKKPPHALVIVFEWDICLFKAMLYYFDLTPVFETQKIVFLIGDDASLKRPIIELFSSMLFDITTFPNVIFTLSAARNFKKEYLMIHRCVFQELTFVISCIGNSHQDDMNGIRNLLANAKEVLKSPYLSSMKDKCRGMPAIIVSNGPSLDLSIPLLKKMQGRCLMICSESAIIPLTKNGIRPDIMVALERTKTNYLFHFKDRNHSEKIALFALTMVDPRTFPSFAGEKIPIFRQGEGLSRWFNRHLGDGSELDAGASVAHLALSSAIHLGADPIIFVGQDLAYGPEGVTHSKDALASQEEGKQARKTLHSFPTVYVEGNNGEMIASNQLWVNFRIIMESIIFKHPEHKYYNATEGGAKITGTERAKLGDLIERYCAEPVPFRINELIAEERLKVPAAERVMLLDKLITDVEYYASFFRERSHEANLKRLECERMMLLCYGKNEEIYRDILDETYKNNIAAFYRNKEDDLCDFFTQRLLCAYFYHFSRLGNIDTQEKRGQTFDLHRQFFRDLRVVSQSLAVTLEEAAKSLQAARGELKEGAV